MCLVQIKQAQIKFPLSGFWTVQRVCPPPALKAGYTLAGRWGGGGSIFRKTPDIGLASYSIIPLRFHAMLGYISVYFIIDYARWLFILQIMAKI
jgi:hypothetical protein